MDMLMDFMMYGAQSWCNAIRDRPTQQKWPTLPRLLHLRLWFAAGVHWWGNYIILQQTSIACCCSWWTFWKSSFDTQWTAEIRHWTL